MNVATEEIIFIKIQKLKLAVASPRTIGLDSHFKWAWALRCLSFLSRVQGEPGDPGPKGGIGNRGPRGETVRSIYTLLSR